MRQTHLQFICFHHKTVIRYGWKHKRSIVISKTTCLLQKWNDLQLPIFQSIFFLNKQLHIEHKSQLHTEQCSYLTAAITHPLTIDLQILGAAANIRIREITMVTYHSSAFWMQISACYNSAEDRPTNRDVALSTRSAAISVSVKLVPAKTKWRTRE